MKNTISTIQEISSLKELEFEGYLWYSDANKPVIFKNKKLEASMLTPLPFVVEGMLFSRKENTSIRIVNIDGEYRIAKIVFENLQEESVTEYFAKKALAKEVFGETTKIRMYEHWEEKPDVLNQYRPVLKYAWSAFVGFKK